MKISLIICILVLLLVGSGFTQEPANPQPPTEGRTVIDLTKLGKTYTISARMELPQVRIFDKRITPDFKEVTAEKSFENELNSQSEQFSFEPITSGKVKPIPNMEALLKKKRF